MWGLDGTDRILLDGESCRALPPYPYSDINPTVIE